MKPIKFRRMIALFISFCLGLAACGGGEATQQNMLVFINLAGKQRMLTQKMTKEALLIAKGINVAENQHNLRQTADLFERTLTGLFDGDSELGLLKIESPQILEQLNQVVKLWQKFQINVDAVLAGNTSTVVLKNIARQNLPLLNEMNTAVKMYERQSRTDLEQPWQAVTINLAGKQRMLTQKMAKELLLVAIGIEPEQNQANLAETVSQFERTLTGLLEGDSEFGLPRTKETAIRNQLETVKALWEEYKPFVAQNKVFQADLITAATLNNTLLEEMDKAVQMYTESME